MRCRLKWQSTVEISSARDPRNSLAMKMGTTVLRLAVSRSWGLPLRAIPVSLPYKYFNVVHTIHAWVEITRGCCRILVNLTVERWRFAVQISQFPSAGEATSFRSNTMFTLYFNRHSHPRPQLHYKYFPDQNSRTHARSTQRDRHLSLRLCVAAN